MDKLIEIISELFSRLNPRGKWGAIIGVIIGIMVLIIIGESFTGINFFNKMQKKVDILSDLYEMSEIETEPNNELKEVYQETINEISQYEVKPLELQLPNINNEKFIKGLTGGLIWFVFGIMAFWNVFGKENSIVGGVFMLLIGLFFGWIGTVLPTMGKPWVNYVFLPIIELILLLLLGSYLGKKKTKISNNNQ
jgi:hypothetical protein